MKLTRSARPWLFAAALALPATLVAGELPTVQSNSPWFTDANTVLQDRIARTPVAGGAKNVILFVGDGMGVSTLTAARIYQGQQRGETGEENLLSFETFPHSALVKTYNTNQQTPDSAGTMTAMMTGVKTKAGVINFGPETIRANCGSTQDQALTTGFMLAEELGMATGVVTTARITHATPAATYARTPDRNWEDDGDLPQEAIDRGCVDIAAQLVQFPYGDGIDVAMGGGRRHFLPNTMMDPEDTSASGSRTDGRDLTAEWMAGRSDATFVYDQAGFDAMDTASINHLLGLFERSHMEYEADRETDAGGEPSLTEMTLKAIQILDKNPNGYFLVVEAGRIDHAHHAGNAARALEDTVELSNAVQAAVGATDQDDTLILVTADHSHVFTIAGYADRGNPILGLSGGTGADGLPYTTLGYTNGPGVGTMTDGVYMLGARADLTGVNVESVDFRQEALIPLGSETHSAEDITVHAIGPGSALLFGQGTIEQNVIFHIINRALNLGGKAY